jgi:hypothetical protein
VQVHSEIVFFYKAKNCLIGMLVNQGFHGHIHLTYLAHFEGDVQRADHYLSRSFPSLSGGGHP